MPTAHIFKLKDTFWILAEFHIWLSVLQMFQNSSKRKYNNPHTNQQLNLHS